MFVAFFRFHVTKEKKNNFQQGQNHFVFYEHSSFYRLYFVEIALAR